MNRGGAADRRPGSRVVMINAICYIFEVVKVQNKEIFEIHAEYCRVLANPTRLAIMACLDLRELSVTELAEALEAPLSTVSRHLGVLKGKSLVRSRQEGTKVFYRPSDRRIIEACEMIWPVLIDGRKRTETRHRTSPPTRLSAEPTHRLAARSPGSARGPDHGCA